MASPLHDSGTRGILGRRIPAADTQGSHAHGLCNGIVLQGLRTQLAKGVAHAFKLVLETTTRRSWVSLVTPSVCASSMCFRALSSCPNSDSQRPNMACAVPFFGARTSSVGRRERQPRNCCGHTPACRATTNPPPMADGAQGLACKQRRRDPVDRNRELQQPASPASRNLLRVSEVADAAARRISE